MRFLQLHTFYRPYLDELYRSDPALQKAPFAAQMHALHDGGFAGGHMFAPPLEALGHEARWAIANNPAAQLQWAREENFRGFTEQNWAVEIARAQVEEFKPEVLYLSDPITFDDRFIERLAWKPRIIAGWRAASIPPGIAWTKFDLMLSHLEGCRKKALELGCRETAHFFPGFPTPLAARIAAQTPEWDVTFSGQWTPEHGGRNNLLLRAALGSRDPKRPFSCAYFLATPASAALPPALRELDHGPRWALDMYRALRAGRITINAEIDLAKGEAGNMRLFEAAGSGALVLTEDQPNLGDYFVPGVEVETFANAEELAAKIIHYLDHPSEREAIAKRGQERCLAEYGMEHRAKEFDGLLQEFSGRKSAGATFTFGSGDPAETLLRQATEKLNARDTRGALEDFTAALSARSGLTQARLGLAVAQARSGRSREAREQLRLALAFQPGHIKAKLLLRELLRGEIAASPVISTADRPASASATVEELLAAAAQEIAGHRVDEAFHKLVLAKALRQPRIGLDQLRAVCFTRRGQIDNAREALREELRYFPDNAAARALLESLPATGAPSAGAETDPEFQELLRAARPYTMLGESRLYSLFRRAKEICLKNLPGNFVECGVAAGGSTALLASVLKRHSQQPRFLFCFDSFEGMPPPTAHDRHQGVEADDTGWGTGTCAATEASVREICATLGVLDVVRVVKGYFQETLPLWRDRVGMLSLLHLDGDWYESTQVILENLYERVLDDGFLQVDDYGYWEGCQKAIHEFEQRRGLRFAIHRIDDTGVWFSKPDRFPINTSIPRELIEDFYHDDPVARGVTSQMSVNERFQLYFAIRKLAPAGGKVGRFVEIGSYAGASLTLTRNALKRSAPRIQGIAVEPGGQPQFFEVLRQLGDEIIHVRAFSHPAAAPLAEAFAKDGISPILIMVDGDHTYEGVRQDIVDYYPMLAPGGLMIFHDWLPAVNDHNREAIYSHHARQEPGIRRACAELMEEQYRCQPLDLPLLRPTDATQTQAHLPIIPGVFSTLRVYRKPVAPR